jgi:hypothetical protein
MAAGDKEAAGARISHLADHLARSAEAAEAVFARARARRGGQLMPGGKADAAALDQGQHMAHGLMARHLL